MRALCPTLMVTLVGMCLNAEPQAPVQNRLWYRRPASKWTEALPLGNGRLGAMVFGAVPKERLQLNEESLWAGEPADPYPENAVATWRQLQQLVLQGKIREARELGLKKLTKSPTSFRSYEPLADLWIEAAQPASKEGYVRTLDLPTGVARVSYRAGSTTVTREIFISAVDDVLAVRLSADSPGQISVRISLTRKKDAQVRAVGARLLLDGQIVDVEAPKARDDNPGGSGPGGPHMKFAGRLLVKTNGGTVRGAGDGLQVSGADEAVILFTAVTDYNVTKLTFDRAIDPARRAEDILAHAARRPWPDLLQRHRAEHEALFNRVALDVGRSAQDAVPTDDRLTALKEGTADPGLLALYFQFGRYLLMASSRHPGRLPANLQGIWNDRMWAPWEADYHLNINLQMNYWPADLCNLSETMNPLVSWFVPVTQRGRTTARRLYGANGWVAYTCCNPFGRVTPGGSTTGSQFVNGVCDPLAGAWMAMTLWRHYEFTCDTAFLRTLAYPVLKGAAAFILDFLVEDSDGYLVTIPSTSPENSYIHPTSGAAVRLTRASTYHIQIIRAVLGAVSESSRILGVDADLRATIARTVKRLPPVRIGKDGTVQEWIEDYQERHPGHRHMSHLLGLHPFAQITRTTPELFAAATKTIARRLASGGGHTGWSRAWIINFYARLMDGDAAHEHVLALLRKSTHPNIFDNHPPFQIDGNFGGTAGIAEMLLQSHAGEIHVLPALPRAWPRGSVRGLKARGGSVVDIEWRAGEPKKTTIHAGQSGTCRVRSAVALRFQGEAPPDVRRDGAVLQFTAVKGRTYRLIR